MSRAGTALPNIGMSFLRSVIALQVLVLSRVRTENGFTLFLDALQRDRGRKILTNDLNRTFTERGDRVHLHCRSIFDRQEDAR
jgi:hypothetical protein